MSKLHVLTLASLFLISVGISCGPSGQGDIDNPANATLQAVSSTQTPAELFSYLSPSIPFLSTPLSTGSGILIDGGYVLTNYHVVSPYQSARIVFPDGSEFLNVPLVVGDSLRDIAVLGPIDIDLPVPPVASVEDLSVGSPVLLIGYPGEPDSFPQPTLSTGLISRIREWDSGGVTYIQTDQAIAGGQSGGALLSMDGQIIGVSGLGFSEVSYALTASIHDVMIQVEELFERKNASQPTFRTQNFGQPPTRSDILLLDDDWQQQVYLIEEVVDSQIDISVSSRNDIYFDVIDSIGEYYAEVDEYETGEEFASFIVDYPGPIYASIYQFGYDEAAVEINCNCDLNLLADIDDFHTLSDGEFYFGEIDFPGDADTYSIDLKSGEAIELFVTSVAIDAYVYFSGLGNPEGLEISDDDSGGGLYGLDAKANFVAPYSGEFRFMVADGSGWNSTGGYLVKIESR
jgi:hypothetical protein